MNETMDYVVSRNGEVWISEPEGLIRPATATEWLKIWKSAPDLTLKLAERQDRIRD